MVELPPLLPPLAAQLERYLTQPELLPLHDTAPAQQSWWVGWSKKHPYLLKLNDICSGVKCTDRQLYTCVKNSCLLQAKSSSATEPFAQPRTAKVLYLHSIMIQLHH